MAFFPIDFCHKPNATSFSLQIWRVKPLLRRISVLRKHHFSPSCFSVVRLWTSKTTAPKQIVKLLSSGKVYGHDLSQSAFVVWLSVGLWRQFTWLYNAMCLFNVLVLSDRPIELTSGFWYICHKKNCIGFTKMAERLGLRLNKAVEWTLRVYLFLLLYPLTLLHHCKTVSCWDRSGK